jgi:hypothetical protein
MSHYCRLVSIAFLLASAAPIACAEEHYRLQGQDARGPFTSWVNLEPNGDKVTVERVVSWRDGTVKGYRGTVSRGTDRAGSYLAGPLRAATGALGALEARGSLVVGFSFRVKGSRCNEAVTQGESVVRAKGKSVKRSKPEAAEPSASRTKAPNKTVSGRLLGLADKEAKRVLAKGVKAKVGLSDWAHVSVRASVRPVSKLTPEQTQASSKGQSVWLATELGGGVRLGHTTEVELGGAKLSLGFRRGTELSYRVVDRYPLAAGETAKGRLNVLRGSVKDGYQLPLTAGEARAMGLGAERTFLGTWEVLFSGGLAVGSRAEGRIGLSGSYRLRDAFRLTVRRVGGTRVRLELVRAKSRKKSVRASALIGLAVKDQIKDAVPALSFFAKKIGRSADKLMRFELRIAASRARRGKLELIYEFDLAKSGGAAAYDRAMRGDMRDLPGAGTATNGVSGVARTVSHEHETHMELELGISKLAGFRRSRTTTRSASAIVDGDGARTERGATVVRGKGHTWFFRDEDHRLTMEGLWIKRPGESPQLSVHIQYAAKDERTSGMEFFRFKGALAACGFVDAYEVAKPGKKNRMELDVVIGDRGLRRIMSASAETIRQQYAISVEAIEGRGGGGGRTHANRANAFASSLAQIRGAATQTGREAQFIELAQKAKWELYEIGALVRLAGWGQGTQITARLNDRTFRTPK